MDLTPLVELIAKIPNTAWSALGGALLTLIPVILSNRQSNKQQKQQQDFESRQQARQLEFDSVEHQRERLIGARRDVYLPAADALVGMIGALGKMLGQDPSSAEHLMSAARVFGAAITRIQMVASAETVKHVAEYQRAFLTALSVVQPRHHAMMLRQGDIDAAHNMRQRYHDERMRFIELMKEYNVSGAQDAERFRRIERQAAFVDQRWGEEHSQWLRLMLDQETARLELAREYVGQMTKLAELQVPALVAIRGELESGEDELPLIEEEARKTAIVGVQAVNGSIPMLEMNIESLRADVRADEEARQAASKALSRPR